MLIYLYSLGLITVSLCIKCAPECDSSNDISIRPLTVSGVQNTLSEMVSDYKKPFCVFFFSFYSLGFSLYRHSCNPAVLFAAEVEKYCPDNMVQIKVSFTSMFTFK